MFEWLQDAACADYEAKLFFGQVGRTPYKDALRICGGCLVREECATYALENDERQGFWAGFNFRLEGARNEAAAWLSSQGADLTSRQASVSAVASKPTPDGDGFTSRQAEAVGSR